MYHIKDDQRSIRSSELLYDGLAELMGKKPFTAITVKDVVESAKVGRTTFYRNFDEIEDILRLRCDKVFEELIDYLRAYLQKNRQESETRVVLLKPLLRYFYLHSDIIELLMKVNRLDIIQESFRMAIEPFKTQIMSRHDVAEEYADYGLAIRTGVMMNILIYWIQSGKKQAPDDLADNLGKMINQMVTLDQFL